MGSFREFISKGEYDKLICRLGKCCKLEQIGTAQGYPVYKTIINPKGKDTLVVLGGIHGNERSGPLGITYWLEHNPKPKCRIVVMPCCNPSGYEDNTRHSRNRKDVNRHFKAFPKLRECRIVYDAIIKEKPKLVLAMHENLESNCFLYYTGLEFTSLCKDIIKLSKKYFPIFVGGLEDNGGNPKGCTESKNGLVYCVNTEHDTLEDRLVVDGITTITTELPTKRHMSPRIHLTKEIIDLVCQKL